MRRHPTWILPLLLLAAGCGRSSSGVLPDAAKMEEISLGDVGELYRVYSASMKKPPTNFAAFKGMDVMNPMGYQALKDGGIVVRYGAVMVSPELEGPGKSGGDEVLAYQKKVPESGGQVLMLDRSIKMMTPEEFKAARKAGPEPSTK